MFSPIGDVIEDDYFANINYNKNIECIIPSAELLINFRSNGLIAKRSCIVYAEKMDMKALFQLRITEKHDQRRMYMTTVDSTSFHELKHDQSLHVTFPGFVENLVRILNDCQNGKLEINLVQLSTNDGRGDSIASTSNGEYQLQFLEMRSFKNLIHLCLPCRLAPLNVVLFYLNSILDNMQKRLATSDHSNQQLQNELQSNLRRFEQLESENAKLRENFNENTQKLNKRHIDELQQLQENMRNISEQRHNENERNRTTIVTLQTQIEKLNAERSDLEAKLKKEHKRYEFLNEELVNTKSNITNLKDHNETLNSEVALLKNSERKCDMHLAEVRQNLTELQEELKKLDKSKADIFAELEAEKNISQTKRQALEMVTEEISKANNIILKQSQELIKLKKTVCWRTEVALQQEKAINDKDKLLAIRNEEVIQLQQIIVSMRKEVPSELDSIKKFANSMELKYKQQINSLKEALHSISGKENIQLRGTSNGVYNVLRHN